MKTSIQIRSAGTVVLRDVKRESFWQLTRNGKTVGWATGYRAAVTKAQEPEMKQQRQPTQQATV